MKKCFWLGGWLILTAFGCASAQEVRFAKDSTLVFTPSGTWKSATIGGKHLPLVANEPVLSVCDVERGDTYTPLSGMAHAEGGVIQMNLSSEALALKADLTVTGDNDAAGFRLRIEDTSGKDRGLLVRVSLPVDALGWQWWDDIERHRTIESGRLYENVNPLRAFAALPEWKDKPDLRMGFNSPNFCTVISGPVGLCLAVPLDQPRIFRTAYDAEKRQLSITYDVALCRETAPPSQAAFEFELSACDAEWGARSALDRYYQRHPDFFTKHFTDEGMWIAFSRLNEIDHVTEFGVTIQEGAESYTYDDKIGVKSFSYYTHGGIYADIPDHKRGVDPTPSLERRIAAVEATLKRNTGRDGAYAECGLYDTAGQLSAEPGTVYGDVLAQFSLEPEMFYGKWLLDRIDDFFDSYRKRGGELDGFYYDGLTTGINYRREHFRHASYPPSWDPIAQKPYLYNYFSSVEWARLVAEKLHTMGKATMMNGAMRTNPFCAPYLDIMGAETGLNISLADFNFVRSICHHKTFVTLLKGNYAQLGSAEIELFMKRCLAYGVFPGYFDWPPSGLGPGGRYWDHPEYYERDRLIFRKYQPLVKQIAAAGWEPLTYARASDPILHIERFGREFFTVLNDSTEPRQSTLVIDADSLALPTEEFVVFDEIAARHLPYQRKDGSLLLSLDLPPQSVAMLQITKKADFVARHLKEAEGIFQIAETQSKVDAGRPTRPIYWNVTEEQCLRDGQALLLKNDSEQKKASASQWAMLFQNEAKPVSIRARVKTQDVSGAKSDSFAIQAIVCYVDKQFTTRESKVLQLEPGTSDWHEVDLQVNPTHPVRSIQIVLRMDNRSGSAWFDKVSVRSVNAPDTECIIDGEFDAWYERLSIEQAALLDPKLDAARTALSALKAERSGKNLAAALTAFHFASTTIAQHHIENPARRQQRDIDAARGHLNACLLPLLHIEELSLTAPDKAAPGESVTVGAKALAPDGAVRRAVISLSTKGSKIDGNQLVIPSDAQPETTLTLHADAVVTLETGDSLPLHAARTISIVPPFDAEARLNGANPANDTQSISLHLENNLSRPQRFRIIATTPKGWTAKNLSDELSIAPQSSATVNFELAASPTLKPGQSDVSISVQGEGQSEPKTFPLRLYHIPASANRLQNSGFELGEATKLSHWGPGMTGYTADTKVYHSGRQSLRLQTNDERIRASAYQSIALRQTAPKPLIVRGWAKTENVKGNRPGCCLYVDIYYTDDTKLYGQKVFFDNGNHDWEFREIRIETTKPIRSVNLHPMLDGVTGTAWFDDIMLAEEP